MKTGDKVKVIADWLPKGAKGSRGTIAGKQSNGETFYRINWKHAAKHGCLFPKHELRAI